MVVLFIISSVLLLALYFMSCLDGISSWMDEAKFEEENAPQREDEEYKWGDNIKGYKE